MLLLQTSAAVLVSRRGLGLSFVVKLLVSLLLVVLHGYVPARRILLVCRGRVSVLSSTGSLLSRRLGLAGCHLLVSHSLSWSVLSLNVDVLSSLHYFNLLSRVSLLYHVTVLLESHALLL